jgi:hypothetical protein
MRCGTILPLMSALTLAFTSTNWSKVILPALSACKPYCTPTLSNGLRANPVLGPFEDVNQVVLKVQRTPLLAQGCSPPHP